MIARTLIMTTTMVIRLLIMTKVMKIRSLIKTTAVITNLTQAVLAVIISVFKIS